MRFLLAAALVACSAPAKTPSGPISNQPADPAPPPPPPVVAHQQPTCTETTMKCAMEFMEYFQVRICDCKDKACAEATNDAMTKWGADMAKRTDQTQREKPDPAFAQRAADVMTRYTECMTKLFMEGTPPPDPCGGGADPCGGDPCGG